MTDKPETVEDVIAEIRARRKDCDSESLTLATFEDVDLDLCRIQAALERERAAWSAEYNKAISEGKIAGYLGSVDLAAIRRVADALDKECIRLESDDASAVELSWHEAMAAELRRACGEKP